jgi:hypothetical protein
MPHMAALGRRKISMPFTGFKGCFIIFEEYLNENCKISLKLAFRVPEFNNFRILEGEDFNLMCHNTIDAPNQIRDLF